MLVVRQVKADDVDQILELASQASFGLTTLPKDHRLLERRVRDALHGFQDIQDNPPRGQAFLFVMEDLKTGRLAGTCGILTKVGGFEPFYAYRIETVIHESAQLNVRKEVKVLHLVTEHNGPCEIGSLFLAPDFRKHGAGRVLSLSRFLYMAEHPNWFDPMVIAEMRGVIDERGQSEFWDALGKHFFDIDFPKADQLSIDNKQFIADLMPRHPIYIALLPEAAQAVIGQVHEDTKPARALLEQEGFHFNGMVDIFEAGPVVTCPMKDIRTVRQSRVAKVTSIEDATLQGETQLIASCAGDFRACGGVIGIEGDAVRIDAPTALALQVKIGDSIRHAPLRAKEAGAP